MRAYSAGGVVFRLVPVRSAENNYATDLWGSELNKNDIIIGRGDDGDGRVGEHVLSPMAVEVALVGRSRAGIWALPKGTPKPGETIEQVATREVEEETGLKVRMIAYIGSISYSFVRDRLRYHKQVRHFLFEAIGGDTSLHDQEYDLVEWFPLSEASRRLTYHNEVKILYQAEEVLQRWLQSRRKEEQSS
jgi:8-oxo-dGTP pyrophosphatase MutT (NUDIX family)